MFAQNFKKKILALLGGLKRIFFKSNHKNPSPLENKPLGRLPNLRQIKRLGQVLTNKEKKIITCLSLLIIFSLFFLFVRNRFLKLEIKPEIGGTYTEGLIGTPKMVNPILAANDIDSTLVRLIFSGLLRYNSDLGLEPDLADNISVSDNKENYTVCLKQNLFWHDGIELTVDDVIFTFELIKNPIFKNPLLERLKQADVVKINDNCLEINAKNPSSFHLTDLTLGILPEHIWNNIDLNAFFQSEFNLKPIGSGPFTFNYLGKDDADNIKLYALKRNEKFHRQSPYIEEIIFKIYSDSKTATEALKTNQINGLNLIPKEIDEELEQNKNLKHYQISLPSYTAIFFNLRTKQERFSPLQEKSVREALAYLTPKKQILKQIFGQEGVTAIYGPFLSQSPVFNPNVQKRDYNPGLAQNIFKQAGWEKKSSGFLEKNGKILEISLTTVDQSDLSEVAHLVQKSWQEAGVKVKLITVPAEQIREIIASRNFDTFLYGILENVDSNPYPLWHSSQIEPPGLNLTGFQDRRVDELLEKAALTNNKKEEQKTYYQKFQELLNQNIPAIFLYNLNYTYLVNIKIKGIHFTSFNYPEDRFINVENWYINTAKK